MTAHKYRVDLTESQKRRLSEVAHRGRSPARTVIRYGSASARRDLRER